jgi:hypothetical protein
MKNGCILCGGVGSGKSRTSLAYYYIRNGGKLQSGMVSDGEIKYPYFKMVNPKDLYIIITARKRDTLEWEGEFAQFLLGEGGPYKNKVVVDSWNNIKKYVEVENAFFIFDEQRVVGRGEWVKSFLKIVKSNEWILLSATPGDTWSDYIPVFIANGFYRNRSEFSRYHIVWKKTKNFWTVERYMNEGRLMRLRDSILVDIAYKRPTELTHINETVTYDVEQYRLIAKRRWNPFEDKPIENPPEYCQVLRRLVNSDPSRMEALLKILKDRKRVIIFYNYNYELDILRNLPYEKGTVVSEWNGHEHKPIPESERWVYLVQYAAGAEGWNCITTDTIIFYSQNYSYKVMIQAAGRIDRMNTPFEELFFYHLRSRSPIDIAISRALSAKKKFNEREYAKEVKLC